MRFQIHEDLANGFANITIGVAVAKSVEIGTASKLEAYRDEIVSAVQKSGYETSTLSTHPAVNAWRNIFRSFGAKPSDYRSSLEALLRRVLKGDGLPKINPVVDIYNLVSIHNDVPSAAYDLDRVKGTIHLRFANRLDKFTPLGSDKSEAPEEREVVYADEEKILCRRWNYRDCEQTKVTSNTKNLVFFLDGAPSFDESVRKGLDELSRFVQEILGCKLETDIASVSAGKLSCELQ